VSGTSDFEPAGYDEDYFAPITESDWTCPPFQFDPPGHNRALGWRSTNWEVRTDLNASALDVVAGDCFNAGLLVKSEEVFLDPELATYSGAGFWPADWVGAIVTDLPDKFAEVCVAEEPVEEEEFVPEPGSIALLGTGLAGLGGYAALRWRTRGKD